MLCRQKQGVGGMDLNCGHLPVEFHSSCGVTCAKRYRILSVEERYDDRRFEYPGFFPDTVTAALRKGAIVLAAAE